MNKVILRQEDILYVKQILSTDINIAIFTFLAKKHKANIALSQLIRCLVIDNMIFPFIDTQISSQISCYRISWQILYSVHLYDGIFKHNILKQMLSGISSPHI